MNYILTFGNEQVNYSLLRKVLDVLGKIKTIINKVSFRNWGIDEAVMKSDH